MKRRIKIKEFTELKHRPLNERHFLAISMTAAGATNNQISRALNISTRMVFNWKQRRDFQDAVDVLREKTRDAVSNEVRSMVFLALRTLRTSMEKGNGNNVTARDALFAATKILTMAGVDQTEIGADEFDPDESFL